MTLLAEAAAAGLTIESIGDRLRITGPRHAAATAKRLLAHKAETLAALAEIVPSTAGFDGRNDAGRDSGGVDHIHAIPPPIAGREDGSDVVVLVLDHADRAALEYLAGEQSGGPVESDPPLTAAVEVNDVVIPSGWSVAAWRRELRRMAERCRPVVPDRAAELRRQARRLGVRQSGVDSLLIG